MSHQSIRTFLKDRLPLIIMFAAACVLECAVIFPIMTADYINYDSSYQYALTQHSIPEIMELLPYDYSPPFYAIALKLFTMAFGNTLTVMRVFTLIAVIGMFFIAAFPMKTLFGSWSAGMCLVVTFCSTVILDLLHEIRPTIFAMFFFMAATVYSALAYSQEKRYAYVCMTVFSVLCMYTHNISLVGMFSIYVVLLAVCLIRKEFRKFRAFLISGVVSAVLYIPWLTVLLSQISNVNDHFWTAAFGWNDALRWIVSDMFMSKTSFCVTIIGAAIVVSLIAAAVRHVDFKKVRGAKSLKEIFVLPEEKSYYLDLLIIFLFITVTFLLLEAVNLLVRNLTSERYYGIVGMAFIVLFSGIVGKLGNRICNIVLAVMLLINNGANTKTIYDDLQTANQFNLVDAINEIKGDGEISFLHTHEWSVGLMAYYFPDATHYVCDDTFTVLRTFDVFPVNIVNIGDYHDIWDYTDEFFCFTNGYETSGSDLTPNEQIVSDISEGHTESDLGTFRIAYNVACKSFELAKITK